MDDPRARYERPIVEQVIGLLMIRHPRVLLPLFPCDKPARFGKVKKGADEDDDQGDVTGVVIVGHFFMLFHEYCQDAVLWSSIECGWFVVIGIAAVDLDRDATVEPTREGKRALKLSWVAIW